MITIAIFFQIIMILGESVLLGVLNIGDKALDFYFADEIFLECRSDEDFIFYDRHEC